jgi:hypothetical protein
MFEEKRGKCAMGSTWVRAPRPNTRAYMEVVGAAEDEHGREALNGERKGPQRRTKGAWSTPEAPQTCFF